MLNAFYAYNENKMGKKLNIMTSTKRSLHEATH